ncbi:hypothetical protein D3C72_1425760 [compost metagenome]
MAMLEAGHQQNVAPGVLHEPQHTLWQFLAQQRLIQSLLDSLAGQSGSAATFLGITNPLLKQFPATAFVTGERKELIQQFRKYRRVVDKLVQKTLRHLLDAPVQTVALMITGLGLRRIGNARAHLQQQVLQRRQYRGHDLISLRICWRGNRTGAGVIRCGDCRGGREAR